MFLQGSYCNDTNVYAESDVDIVICLKTLFYHDLTLISEREQAAFQNTFGTTNESVLTFKPQVLAHLQRSFGAIVRSETKAIKIPGAGDSTEC